MAFEKKDFVWLGSLGLVVLAAVALLATGKVQFVGKAEASTFKATACTDHYAGNCTPGTNACSAGSCNVTFKINGSSVDVFLNGTRMSSEFICLPRNATDGVTWNSIANSTQQTDFLVDFGDGVPFLIPPSNVITGTSNGSAARTSTPDVNACFEYNVKVCNVVTGSGVTTTCGSRDPKIIIGNP